MNFLRTVLVKHFVVNLAALAFLLSTMSFGAPMGKVKFVDVDGVKTSYFEGGSGEAMVLVHGGSFGSTVSANCWSPIFDDLAAHFHVYVIDKLGQGYTDNPLKDADYTMDAVTRHIHDDYVEAELRVALLPKLKEAEQRMTSVLDRSELHFFNQSGHYVFQEYPREITRLMVDFIRSSQD